MTDLVFRRAPYAGGPLDLVFGAVDGDSEPEILPLTLECRVSLSGPRVTMTAVYDNRLPSLVSTGSTVRHQAAATAGVDHAAQWAVPDRITQAHAARHQSAADISAAPPLAWQQSGRVGAEHAARHADASPVAVNLGVVYQACTPVDLLSAIGWQEATPFSRSLTNGYQAGSAAQLVPIIRSRQGSPISRSQRAEFQAGTPVLRALVAAWQEAQPIPPGLTVYVIPGDGDGDGGSYTPSMQLVFACPPHVDGEGTHLVFGHSCLPDEAVSPGQIIVPVRSVYMTTNSLTLTRLSDGAPLKASGFSMSLDEGSWTWSWSATASGSSLSLLSPEVGDPVAFEVVVNGVAYRLLAEEVGRTRSFGENAISISGRGLAAALDSPYAATLNFSASADRTAQQLANEALQINGVSIGWDLEWNIEDWLVPGGVWSLQGSHIAAVAAIAAAAGGYVQPHATAQTLRVLHRYPAAPWDWGDVTPDIILPSEPVVVEGIKWASKVDYNRVFVSGETAGVLGQVTRTGTAGDTEASMVVDQLMTASEVARQRGRAVLSDTGRQALVSLSLPVLAETGLILPGSFVQYVDGSETRRGIVRSSALSWERPRMRQQISVETHETA